MPFVLSTFLALLIGPFSQAKDAEIMPSNPIAKKTEKKLTAHGDVRVDEYFWLKERDTKPVLRYLEEENAYTKANLKPTLALQKKLVQEMRSRMKEDESTAPVPNPPYFYYS